MKAADELDHVKRAIRKVIDARDAEARVTTGGARAIIDGTLELDGFVAAHARQSALNALLVDLRKIEQPIAAAVAQDELRRRKFARTPEQRAAGRPEAERQAHPHNAERIVRAVFQRFGATYGRAVRDPVLTNYFVTAARVPTVRPGNPDKAEPEWVTGDPDALRAWAEANAETFLWNPDAVISKAITADAQQRAAEPTHRVGLESAGAALNHAPSRAN